MQRPQVRQIEQQGEETREVTGTEAEELLRKYGYGENQQLSSIPDPIVKQKPLSFEEMIKQQEDKEKKTKEREIQKRNGSNPKTFNAQNGYDSITKYASDEESGLGFKIEISSDMKIPRY